MQIGTARLVDPDVRDLLELHQRRMFAVSPPGTSFALDLSGLSTPGITLFAARGAGELLGVAALRDLGSGNAELKSMRAGDNALRTGVGQAMLDHIVAHARGGGHVRLLLETGTGPDFVAATALYRKNGFTPRGPFGDYAPSDFNLFFELTL